ncbi:autotransporter domain-containing protein [Planctomicrobium sp. SH527]|uniref:autotransporter domain-containing protein n=1 Tax=Planctomicrobium sp. SH527 TaxID=3448123 RepID=UPI003F5AF8EF
MSMFWTLKKTLMKRLVLTGAFLSGFVVHSVSFAQIVDTVFDGSNDGARPESIIRVEYWNPSDGNFSDPFWVAHSSDQAWTADEMGAVQRGMQYWWDVLGEGHEPGRVITVRAVRNTFTAGGGLNAYAAPAIVTGSDPLLTHLQNVWAGGQVALPGQSTDGGYVDTLLAFEMPTFSTEMNGVYSRPGAALEAIMIHELAHSLGYIGPGTNGSGQIVWGALGSGVLSLYEEQIVDANGDSVVAGDTASVGTPFFFAGTNAVSVYGGNVPLNTRSSQTSHLGVPTFLMTHEAYRNYTFMTEVELAVLKDLGFSNIDLKKHFGQSYYQNGVTGTNTNGFNSDKTFGVGLHMKANSLNITQAEDLIASGVAGTGVRIDGNGNTVTIGQGVNVQADGDFGVGMLVSNGSRNVIVHRGAITADSTTADAVGTGMLFSFGTNVLGDVGAPDLRSDTPANASLYPGHVPGYLVDRVDISGSISAGGGSGNVIHIDNTAAVREINILNGANLSGNIYTDSVINSGMGLNRPTMQFGNAQVNGVKQGGADANFTFTYDGNITSFADPSDKFAKSMNAEFVGGSASATGAQLNGDVIFNNANIAQTGKLTVGGDFVGKNITNNGSTNVLLGARLEADQLLQNNGSLSASVGDIVSQKDLVNAGTMTLFGTSVTVAEDFNNTGTFNQTAGTLDTLNFDNSGTADLSFVTSNVAGTLANSGTLSLSALTEMTVAGEGTNSNVLNVAASQISFLDGFTNTSAGRVNLSAVGNLDVTGDLQNFGKIYSETLGSVTVTDGDFVIGNRGEYVGNASAVTIDNGDLIVNNLFSLNGGALNVDGDIRNTRNINLTNAAGFVDGDLNNDPTGVFKVTGTAFVVQDDINNKGLIQSATGIFVVVDGDFNVLTGGRYSGVDDAVIVGTGGINISGVFASRDGNILSTSDVIVNSGGRLQGTATIAAPAVEVKKGGTIAAGNSIGTMNIVGDLFLDGNNEVEITSSTIGQDADLINVQAGTAFINSGVTFANRGTFNFVKENSDASENFEIARRYTVLQTENDGDLQVNYRPVAQDNLTDLRMILRSDKDLDALYTADARDYYAYVGRDVDYTTMANNTNQLVIANLLESYRSLDNGTVEGNQAQWVRDTFDLIVDEADVTRAYDQLVGASYTTILPTIAQQIHINTQRMAAAMRNDNDLTLDGSPVARANGLYGILTGFGTGGNVKDGRHATGYDYSSGGTQLQIGYSQEGVLLGGYYNYTSATVESINDVGVDMHDFGGFFLKEAGIGHFLFSAGGGVADLDSRRVISIGNTNVQNPIYAVHGSDNTTNVYNTIAEYGVNVAMGPVTLRPFGGLSYVYVDRVQFNEGNDYLAVNGEMRRFESFRSHLGTDLNFSFPRSPATTMNLRASWMHEYQNDRAGTVDATIVGLTTQSFTSHGVDLGTDFALFGVTLSHYFVPGHVRIFGGYDLIANNRSDFHTGTGGIELLW